MAMLLVRSRAWFLRSHLVKDMKGGGRGRPLPKFGEWDVNNPSSAEGFTMIFTKARDEKKNHGTSAGSIAPIQQRNDNPNRQNVPPQSASHRQRPPKPHQRQDVLEHGPWDGDTCRQIYICSLQFSQSRSTLVDPVVQEILQPESAGQSIHRLGLVIICDDHGAPAALEAAIRCCGTESLL
ncbi:RIN4, pathogenic type III effector avirulence factor Avr cleavage site [Dillenia turbinata]|uniref:RIN4, pathogenic type III effector avirulence factor Avr cleavage site n=1 Tax=Dillenia turbinata TaxID=194707 RepID=A0AAN8V6I1_9MAGN